MTRPLIALAFATLLTLARLGSAWAGISVVIEAIDGSGEVAIDRHGQQQIAQEGDKVEEGEKVSTSSGVAARLLYPDGSRLLLSEGSLLQIQPARGSAPMAELSRGSVRALIEKSTAATSSPPPFKFFIKTNAAVMGVRGTDFYVDIDDKSGTSLHTVEGLVEIANKPDDLFEGRGARVAAGQAITAAISQLSQVARFELKRFAAERARRCPRLEELYERTLAKLHDRRHQLLKERLSRSREGLNRGDASGRGDGTGRAADDNRDPSSRGSERRAR